MAANDTKGPAIHPAILNELRKIAGVRAEDELRELGTLFLQESVAKLTIIASALDSRDVTKMQRAAQSLRASSGNIGAERFSQLCHQLSQMGELNDPEPARVIARALREEFVRVRAELDRLLLRSKAA